MKNKNLLISSFIVFLLLGIFLAPTTYSENWDKLQSNLSKHEKLNLLENLYEKYGLVPGALSNYYLVKGDKGFPTLNSITAIENQEYLKQKSYLLSCILYFLIALLIPFFYLLKPEPKTGIYISIIYLLSLGISYKTLSPKQASAAIFLNSNVETFSSPFSNQKQKIMVKTNRVYTIKDRVSDFIHLASSEGNEFWVKKSNLLVLQ